MNILERTRERSCCPDMGFIFCYYIPTSCPTCDCKCDCLPRTTCTHCCGGGCHFNNCGDCGGGDNNDNPVVIIIILVLLALLLVALIAVIAFLIYRLVSYIVMCINISTLPVCLVGWWQATRCCKAVSYICCCIWSGSLYHYDSDWNCFSNCICWLTI